MRLALSLPSDLAAVGGEMLAVCEDFEAFSHGLTARREFPESNRFNDDVRRRYSPAASPQYLEAVYLSILS